MKPIGEALWTQEGVLTSRVAFRGLATQPQRVNTISDGEGPGGGGGKWYHRVDVILSSVGGVALSLVAQYVWMELQRWIDDPNRRARRLLDNCAVPKLAKYLLEQYIERPGVEERIDALVRREVPSKYLVVVGPRGGGKSTAVMKKLADRQKVVYVTLSSARPTIAEVLRPALWPSPSESVNLAYALQGFEELEGADKPVLVVEIDSNATAETVRTQSQELKICCVDRALAHGILVLSDANAASKLNPDPHRQEFLWVGDFDAAEVVDYLDKLGVLPACGEKTDAARELRRRLIDEVGALPQTCRDMATVAKAAAAQAVEALPAGATEVERVAAATTAEHKAVERFIEKTKKWASAEVTNLLTRVPSRDVSDLRADLRRLVLALCDAPEGVPAEKSGVSPLEVGEVVKAKGFPAVTYNEETNVFQFYTRAHEHAARAWFAAEKAADRAEAAELERVLKTRGLD